jgi:L-2-hydroxyglutarate oxidase
MSAGEAPAQIIPFRGEYFELKPEAWHLCKALIYPVPDPGFPFLGVHFTRMIAGGVECGPNAVLAFAREGYYLTAINGRELWETLSYPGFRKLAGRYWKTGSGEIWRSASKRAFVKALQRLVPEIQREHLEKAPAGIRAQALAPGGALVDDFAFHESRRIVNVINAPSPAATSALSIAESIVDKLEDHF